MRKKIVAGNWKMNTDLNQAIDLAKGIVSAHNDSKIQLILCPPFPFIYSVSEVCKTSSIAVGAQNCNKNLSGAFTGEVSVEMLSSLGVIYVLVGHSERRTYFKETNQELAEKVNACLSNNLIPIFCCGEQLEQRNKQQHFSTVKTQIQEALFHLNAEEIEKTIIAYEPVWAIGTGVTASPAQAQEMHQFIRHIITDKYGKAIAENISILYGGSCNAANAKELFALPDVDGGLIGGASLKVTDFIAISTSF
jgi:triosephosphate isomerase